MRERSASNIGITFENNRATNNGGAVFSWNGLLSNNRQNNTADMGQNGSAGDVNITNCTFQINSASIGGAIFVVSGQH